MLCKIIEIYLGLMDCGLHMGNIIQSAQCNQQSAMSYGGTAHIHTTQGRKKVQQVSAGVIKRCGKC